MGESSETDALSECMNAWQRVQCLTCAWTWGGKREAAVSSMITQSTSLQFTENLLFARLSNGLGAIRAAVHTRDAPSVSRCRRLTTLPVPPLPDSARLISTWSRLPFGTRAGLRQAFQSQEAGFEVQPARAALVAPPSQFHAW